jgi:very-short-patch-repair endonuclease/ribosome-associated translation inhibitor RaiA
MSRTSTCIYCSASFIVTAGARGKYCSPQCSANGLSVRYSEIAAKEKIKKEQKYFENPTVCNNCSNVMTYSIRKNKFCSKSCSATFNNTGRIRTEESKQKVSASIIGILSKIAKTVKIYCCTICSEPTVGNRKTCSKECLTKHHSILQSANIEKNRHRYKGRLVKSYMEKSFHDWLIAHGLNIGVRGFMEEVHFKHKVDGKTKNGWADFVFPSRKLIIELDGSHHKKRVDLDAVRDKHLTEIRGYTVIRIPHSEYTKGTRIEEIKKLLGLK